MQGELRSNKMCVDVILFLLHGMGKMHGEVLSICINFIGKLNQLIRSIDSYYSNINHFEWNTVYMQGNLHT